MNWRKKWGARRIELPSQRPSDYDFILSRRAQIEVDTSWYTLMTWCMWDVPLCFAENEI